MPRESARPLPLAPAGAWTPDAPVCLVQSYEDFQHEESPMGTKDSIEKAWDKTKEVASDAAEATKSGAGKAWDKTKEVATETADAARRAADKVS